MSNTTQPQQQTILLNRFQYCHVLDRNTGAITLHEGEGGKGKRIQLESHEELVGTWEKICVPDGAYAIVLNPFDAAARDIAIGEREVRPGPREFALHPGEALEGGKVHAEHILTDDEALLLRAEKDAPHPLAGTQGHDVDAILRAGEEFLLTGPRRFIPHKDVRIKEQRTRISLAAAEGTYVQNDDTGVVRLVQGPADFFLSHNESLWSKRLTDEEQEALGYTEQDVGDDSRVLASTPRARKSDSDAIVLDLEDNEAIYVYDGTAVRVEFGPQTVFLAPHEHPKVLFISGGVPVKPNALRIAERAGQELEFRTTVGGICSGERFVADDTEKLWLRKQFGGTCIDMETGAIAQARAKLGIPWVGIRVISDGADRGAAVDFQASLALASDRIAQIVPRIVTRLVGLDPQPHR